MTDFPAPSANQTNVDLSIIIVARDEADSIGHLIQRLHAQHPSGWNVEIVLCDGNSSDATAEIARAMGAIVTTQSGGRGAQLKRGAQMARGRWLWFLHADCVVPRNAVRAIRRVSLDSRVIGGNFRLKFAGRQFAARVFEFIARLQRPCGIYYGDSGIWVRRDIYESLGGFQSWPLFEDFDFVRRMENFARKNGYQTRCLRPALSASSRRFARHPWRVLWLWMRLQWRFQCGDNPAELARFYYQHRS